MVKKVEKSKKPAKGKKTAAKTAPKKKIVQAKPANKSVTKKPAKTSKKAEITHERVQTAEGWRRMMKAKMSLKGKEPEKKGKGRPKKA